MLNTGYGKKGHVRNCNDREELTEKLRGCPGNHALRKPKRNGRFRSDNVGQGEERNQSPQLRNDRKKGG